MKIQLPSIVFSAKSMDFISSCDLKDHKSIWNVTAGKIIGVKKEIRQHYLRYQKNLCAYCRTEVLHDHGLYWDIEHIIPKDKYAIFLFEPRNLTLSCRHCNSKKSNKEVFNRRVYKTKGYPFKIRDYPVGGDFFSIIHPHYDKYSNHIEMYIYESRIIYEPKSDKGRNTYAMCNLERFVHIAINDTGDQDIIDFIGESLLNMDDGDLFEHSPREKKLMDIILGIKSRIEKKYLNRDFA
ncbi:HNH endonuclease [Klebsiella variicola]|nr:HNH endonuclease [Klebsiella variicola]MCC7650792.1 HNH endonuclease [Klebsiella variicola]HBQ5098704.1 HNH endonuclease [Klebsiella variicola]HBQ5121548.1 HNH endonuclease [Klebsiella variicola]HCA8408619.1 HNH endonuclease [Klebsiella variicola]HCA8415328.1 HNH endonuclease [Klebsiella variicola]